MRTISLLAALLALAGCAIVIAPGTGTGDVRVHSMFGANSIKGDGQVRSETRSIVDASALDISGPLEVELSVGAAASLEIEADSNLLSLVHSESTADGLKIWIDGNVDSAHALRAKLTLPQVVRINSTGSGRLTVTGLHGAPLAVVSSGSRVLALAGKVSRLDVRAHGSGSLNASALDSGSATASLTGSGRLSMGQVRGAALNIDITGSGRVSASGAVRTLNARVHGSGGADLAGLTSQTADLSSTGSGDISAAVAQTLVAQTFGSGRIVVHGNPNQRSISGKHVSVVQ